MSPKLKIALGSTDIPEVDEHNVSKDAASLSPMLAMNQFKDQLDELGRDIDTDPVTIDDINGFFSNRFFTDVNQVETSSLKKNGTYSIFYKNSDDTYTKIADASYEKDDDGNLVPSGQRDTWLRGLGSEVKRIMKEKADVEHEVIDASKDDLHALKEAVEEEVFDPEIQKEIKTIETLLQEGKKSGIQTNKLDGLRLSTLDVIQKLSEKIDTADPAKKSSFEQQLRTAESLYGEITNYYIQKVLGDIKTITGALEKKGSGINTYKQDLQDIKKARDSLEFIKKRNDEYSGKKTDLFIEMDIIATIDAQISLLDEYKIVVSKKKELQEKQAELTAKKKKLEAGGLKRKERKALQQHIKDLTDDVSLLEQSVNIAQGKVSSAETKNTTDPVGENLTKNAEKNNPNHSVVREDGSAGPDFPAFEEKIDGIASVDKLHEAFSGVLSVDQLQRLATDYVLNAGHGPDLEKRIAGLSKAERKYLQRYIEICQKDNRSKAKKLENLLKEERKLLKETVGTTREVGRAGKEAVRHYGYNAEVGGVLEKILCHSMMSEFQEQANKRGMDYAMYLRSYDNPNAPFCGTCPSIYNVESKKDEIMKNFDALLVGTGKKLDNSQKQLLRNYCKGQMTGNGYGKYSEDLYKDPQGVVGYAGHPIYLPPSVDDPHGNTNGHTTYEKDEFNRLAGNYETASDFALMDDIALFVKTKDLNEEKEFGQGHVPVFKEAALRHLSGRDGFSFESAMKSYLDKTEGLTMSDQEIKDLLASCIKTLITPSVADHIHEKYKPYADSKKKSNKNQLVSLYFVDALCSIHGMPCNKRELAKSKLQELFGGGWNVIGEQTLGNDEVGRTVNNYVVSKLGRGLSWLEDPLSPKNYIVNAQGHFRGVTGMIDMASASLVSAMGVDPAHASKIAAYTKIGLSVLAVSYGWNFAKKIFSGTLGDKVRKIGLTALVAGVAPRLIMNRDLGEAFRYFKDGDKDGKGFMGGGSDFLKKWGREEDPEIVKNDPDVMPPKTYVASVFREVKIADLPKYITKGNQLLGGKDHRYYMTELQKQKFMNNPSISQGAKNKLEGLLLSYGGNLDVASEVIDTGLSQSGLVYEKFEELAQKSPTNQMTFPEFQMHWGKAQEFFEEVGDVLGPNEALKNKLLLIYMEHGTDNLQVQQNLKLRITEMKEFDEQYKKMFPLIRYHFIPHRTDLYDAAVPGMTKAGHQKLFMDKMDDESGYMQIIFDYISDDTSGDFAPDKAALFDPLFYTFYDNNPQAKTFLDTYMLPQNAEDNFMKIEKSTGLNPYYKNLDKVKSSAKVDWKIGKSNDNPDDINEVLLDNLPGFSDSKISTFISINSSTKKMGIWLENSDGIWEEFEMTNFGPYGSAIETIGFDNIGIPEEELYMNIGGNKEYFNYKVFEKVMNDLSSGETTVKLEYDWLKFDPDTSPLLDKIAKILAIPTNGPNAATAIVDSLNGAVNTVDEALEQLRKPKMRFKKTGKTRP